MKFLILTFLLVTVGYSTAQLQMCYNRSWFATCVLPGDAGRRGEGCSEPIRVWYYDRNWRQCRNMLYLGCGGNNNRWCTRVACERSCRRW